jgi:flagellar L-ring protein precursor FlgH
MNRAFTVIALLVITLTSPSVAKKKSSQEKLPNSLDEYIQQLAMPPSSTSALTRGSLFTASSLLADPYSDYKAHLVGDTISIQILESTTISQSGSIASERDFSHSSGVTAIGGQSPSFLNPLLAANSSTKLAGTGATASKSSLNTTISAQVVAVLPSGSLVVEARRHVLANHEHENVVLRGVVRPADISSGNLVYSFQLSNLQLEVKGKGVISDSVRQPNIVMRTLLKFIGF